MADRDVVSLLIIRTWPNLLVVGLVTVEDYMYRRQ